MPRHQAVITGLGVVSSIGIGVDEYFDALLCQKSGIRSLADRTDGEAAAGSGNQPPGLWIGAPVVDFDPNLFVRPRKALKVMCREIQTAFAASQLAITHADLEHWLPAQDSSKISPQDVATVFGGEMHYCPPIDLSESVLECVDDQGNVDVTKYGMAARRGVPPLWMLKYLPNMPACHVGISVNARGHNNTIVHGDVSASAALIEAVACIDRGTAKMVITGGAGTRIATTRLNYRGDLPIASIADSVAGSSRPHDPKSTGVVGGEGAAVAILEHVTQAEKRGAKVFATVAGFASRFVGSAAMREGPRSGQNQSHPSGPSRGSAAAVRLAIDGALADAQLNPSDLGLIVSHAMGDPLIDAAERDALSPILANTPMVAPIASLGHTGAASGAMTIATGAMALATKRIPPTVNADRSPNVNLSSQTRPLAKSNVLCLSHTSHGNATAIILN